MANETLSPKQAKAILDTIENIMTTCMTKMENRSEEFIDQLSKLWEDKNAVDFAKKHGANFSSLATELVGNTGRFEDTVVSISNAYGRVGGQGEVVSRGQMAKTGVNLTNIGLVKANFGTDDSFGFKNPDTGADQVQEAFSHLETDLGKLVNDAITQIGQINAFGNVEIKNNLAQSSGKIVEILKDHIATAKTQLHESVQETANAYKKVGNSAASAANIAKPGIN